MKIKIDHIAKMEGHSGFMADIVKGDVKSAKFQVQEGVRLIEGMLVGRHYKDAPIVAQRICGICPVVHNLTCIKAIEKAFDIKVSQEATNLRKILEWAQVIHSHLMHLFFLSLADFLDIENDLVLIKEYPEETKKAVKIRAYGTELVRILGGRTVHPLTNEIGGFKKIPSPEEIEKLIQQGESVLKLALELGEFFRKIKLPEFSRSTEYVSLNKKKEYAIYEGDLVSNKGLHIKIVDFENNFNELHRPREVVKRVLADGKTSYMVGAIARINIQRDKLEKHATNYLRDLNLSFPDYNPFHNILYQMVEVVQGIEVSLKSLKELMNNNLEQALTQDYKIRSGEGTAAVEAPRGALYYNVDIDERGYLKKVNIITPTAQALAHMEDDMVAYLPQVTSMDEKEREKKLRALVRAYDPCFSCAVH